jgi:hypothetical protein
MKNFRLLKRTQQATEYSCGASALQSVLSYWGSDVDEHELMKLMGTTQEEGNRNGDRFTYVPCNASALPKPREATSCTTTSRPDGPGLHHARP